MAKKTFDTSTNITELIKNLSELEYASDFSKDDLGNKPANKNTDWLPEVDRAKPMAHYQFSGQIIGYSNPNKQGGLVLDGLFDPSYKSQDHRESNGRQYVTIPKNKTDKKPDKASIFAPTSPSIGFLPVINKDQNSSSKDLIAYEGYFSGGVPVYKFFNNGNLFLYIVIPLKDTKANVYEDKKFWVQVTGTTKVSYSKVSGVYNDIKTAITTATPNKPKQDLIDSGGTTPNNPKDNPGDINIPFVEVSDIYGNNDSVGGIDLSEWNDNDADYANDANYKKLIYDKDTEYEADYWKNQLYGSSSIYSLKSHNSIIGLPLQFMGNVDFRPGSSNYGKQFLEDIIYDMNIACIKPGGPVLNPKLAKDAEFSDDLLTSTFKGIGTLMGYANELKDKGPANFLKECLFTMFKGSSTRFYSFQSDYTHYTHYVNTLCHLFITFLGIGAKEYVNARGDLKTYSEYTDDYREIESDGGLGLKDQFGFDNAVYLYYSDEGSALNQNFSNSTMESGLTNTIQEASRAVKEWGFLLNASGIEAAKGIVNFDDIAANAANISSSGGVLGRLLGRATEGVTTILAGNNISLPEIYADSSSAGRDYTFKIKLASPYGDPESVFLYVLRPLARLLAFSLPRQFGANSYTSPFIVQAFSKGQFNCQLGIVTELSVTRSGNGGESNSIHHIPTELEVNLTIHDMYDTIFLSNEYFGNGALKSLAGAFVDHVTKSSMGSLVSQFLSTNTAAKLLFNNVGLIDFAASFCGFNLNMPTYFDGWETIRTMMKNRCAEYLSYSENDGWMFPQWEKTLNDSMRDAVAKLTTPVTTLS